MRWQIWESVRGGCQGVVFFAILLGGTEEWTPAQGDMPQKLVDRANANRQRWPTVQKRVHTEQPLCLTYAGGKTTRQAAAMADEFSRLAALDSVLLSLERHRIPLVYADPPGRASSFAASSEENSRFAVVVNDQLEKEANIALSVPPNVTAVTEVSSGTRLSLHEPAIGQDGLRTCTITLPHGGGTLLRLDLKHGVAGFVLYDETIQHRAITATLQNAERHNENRGFGMGRQHRIRAGTDADKPAKIRLEDLQPHHHGRGSVMLTALRDVGKDTARVFLHVQGSCPEPEDIVVSFVDDKGKSGWNKTDDYHRPISVPANTDTIRILLGPNGAVERIRLWRIDR